MRIGNALIDPEADLITKLRVSADPAEARELRGRQRCFDDSPLLVALPVPKEEDAIAADGAADSEAKLPALKEGIRVGGIAVERGVGGQLVIAEEVDAGAVEFVASGPCNHVDRPGIGDACREIEVHGRDLELLHDFLREAHLRAAIATRHDAAPIHRDARSPAITPAQDQHEGAALTVERGGCTPGSSLASSRKLRPF